MRLSRQSAKQGMVKKNAVKFYGLVHLNFKVLSAEAPNVVLWQLILVRIQDINQGFVSNVSNEAVCSYLEVQECFPQRIFMMLMWRVVVLIVRSIWSVLSVVSLLRHKCIGKLPNDFKLPIWLLWLKFPSLDLLFKNIFQ